MVTEQQKPQQQKYIEGFACIAAELDGGDGTQRRIRNEMKKHACALCFVLSSSLFLHVTCHVFVTTFT